MTMNQSHLRDAMRARLTADPRTLDLDRRIDEAPEDMFAAMAGGSARAMMLTVLNGLLFEFFTDPASGELRTRVQFLTRALRLCDATTAANCKKTLKLVLLEDDTDSWGDDLATLHSLAARALLALPKAKNELRFWIDVAHSWEESLPYALRAVFEIDLISGAKLFWEMLNPRRPRLEHPLIDWGSILNDADQGRNEKEVRAVLERTFYEALGRVDPHRYEILMQRGLRLGRFSRANERSLGELPSLYTWQEKDEPADSEERELSLKELLREYEFEPVTGESIASPAFLRDYFGRTLNDVPFVYGISTLTQQKPVKRAVRSR